MKQDHRIVGLHLTDRVRHAGELQAVLTRMGDCIRTRLGLHEAGDALQEANGIILLETAGDDARIEALLTALRGVEGVEVQEMRFTH